MATTTLRVQCHCKSTAFTFPVPSTSFPLSSGLCSCSSCRFATGQLAASFAVFPLDPNHLKLDVSGLSSYASSDHRTRYFCPTCGANVLDFDRLDGMWRACTGALDRTQGLLERNLIFIDDTRDGGLTVWMDGVGKKFADSGDHEPMEGGPARPQATEPAALHPDARLHGFCHCNGVQFDILPPSDGERYEGGLCACTSCRTTAGFEITAWTSVPLSQIQTPGQQSLDLSAGTLKQYTSSPGTSRYFCGRCGATVFCAHDNQSWIDVAVGLLRAKEGSRAERWIKWSELGFPEEATDQEMIKRLAQGFKRWQSERN
ncbi:hypothetical protein H2200_013181 [Cladophialophora chaetospira]|uniref:CENP-V/GFA domain-containing protein n=1 Tax=Cladophialophora chaetospira TaxID=386627 RepID=A0AA38WWB0_9EURO|nr:hypothetical protein H2200_013181 [Cladophialophora chaetospira]